MERMKAIYSRKSVERADSISIESQIEFCEYEARGEKCLIYKDNGFSGKNTDRPAFKQMINDIKDNKISAVIVYKLDRISRSILDFAEMMELFQKYNVEFISATEKFDTSTPIGRAMLNICIVFAQLERETIQKRVMDAYLSRSKKGFYMGGRIPYGFTKEETYIDGIKTSKYVPIKEEINEIKRMYEMYSDSTVSLGDIMRTLEPVNKRGKVWCAARISEVLRNPIYVKSNLEVYEFFNQQGCIICNEPTDFLSGNACYLFKGDNRNRKTWDLSNHNIVISPHQGVIDADIWLKCRKKLLGNHQIKYTKPKNSWLSGKVKCGNCGYAVTIKKSKTKAGRYFICSASQATNKYCSGIGRTIYADEFENTIKNEIAKKIAKLNIKSHNSNALINNSKISELEVKLIAIDNEINLLLSKILQAEPVLMTYINDKINQLDDEKKEINHQILLLNTSVTNVNFNALDNCMIYWGKLSFDDKRRVVNSLINKISVYSDHIEINWLI